MYPPLRKIGKPVLPRIQISLYITTPYQKIYIILEQENPKSSKLILTIIHFHKLILSFIH